MSSQSSLRLVVADHSWRITAEFESFGERLRRGFAQSFQGMIDAMNEGFGPDSVFAQATEQVKSLTELVKGFIYDAVITGQDAGAAANASTNFLVSLLQAKPELTETASELQRVEGQHPSFRSR